MPLNKNVLTKFARWANDPVSFVREELKAEPDPWQLESLKAFPTSKRMAWKACKGPGKTTLLSWLAWNFLLTRPHPNIVATSITADNLRDGLWKEMAKWQNRSPILKEAFEWNKERIIAKDHAATWWMSARTWPKSGEPTAQADTLAGLHAEYLLFILDEAGGIPDAVMAAAEAGLATGADTKLLIAGNPTSLSGPLYRACTSERHLWNVTEITGDPDNPMRAPRIDMEWARAQIEKYGKDNPWVQVNVFGKFPPASMNSLLGVDEVRASMERHLTEDIYGHAQKRLGVDVARFGGDRTVIFPRQGLAAFIPAEMRNARTNEIAGRVMEAKLRWGSEVEFVDDTGGWGAGVIDSMQLMGVFPNAINFSGKASDPRYLNKRAEMWFRMAEWVKKGGALPKDEQLLQELTTPTYTFASGKFQLEDKEQIKQRLGFSPDLADALALTFALSEMPCASSLPWETAQVGKTKYEYDPFESARVLGE